MITLTNQVLLYDHLTNKLFLIGQMLLFDHPDHLLLYVHPDQLLLYEHRD